ncbi:MAG: NAD+ synthase [Candidatus Omnitrophica bacterium]|nr:NAD+ synthase [Candidatus Omnitrophota bacterium]MDD5672432.1 NAD+ synthase [Candidatus Omnitrophota bacterium]
MKKIRFAVAQMNPTVGDYSGNTRKILDWIRTAEKRQADVIVFPEVALCGYPVWDLANRSSFVAKGLECLKRITQSTAGKKVTAVVGFIDQSASVRGRSSNALAWIRDGEIQAKQYKRLLPTYDVFLENIFFRPAEKSAVIPWGKWKVGTTICEDIWDEPYEEKPLADLNRLGANLIINISASPYYYGVADVRDALLKKHTTQYRVPMLYVNQVGAQDDLVFDGRSFFVDAQGRTLFRAPAFEENLFFFDWDPGDPEPFQVPSNQKGKAEEVYQALTLGVRDYCRKNGFKKVVIGLSGGIDSALVATLAVDALGPAAVTGVTMPGSYSSEGSWKDSEELAERLGIDFRVYPIRNKYELLLKEFSRQRKKDKGRSARGATGVKKQGTINLAMENLQARLRGLELMYISNDEGRLLLSTGNKSELAMGYCTLYGDMAGGLAVIGDVYKTDVYRLAWYRNREKEVIPEPILTKAPSAELRPNQKDEDSLPPYEVLDEILYLYIERNQSADDIIREVKKKKVPRNIVMETIRKVDHNEYKRRQTPPVLRVTEKSWFGRRMPITNKFEI